MGSKEESSPSAAAQPLLLHSSGAGGEPSTSLLLPPPSASASSSYDDDPYPPISYLHGRRPVRDLPFSLLFLLLSLGTYILGIVAVARRNPGAPVASSYVFDPSSSSCVPPSSTSDLLLRLLSSSSPSSSFLKKLIWTLVVTFLLAGPIGFALLWLLRRYARQVVYTAVPFFVLVPASLNVYWFVACALADGCRHAFPLPYRVLVLVFVFVLIAIVLWIIIANWHRVRLTALILQVAAGAFAANLGLLVFLPALEIGLLVFFAPVIVFLVFSTWNGSVVPMEVTAASREIFKCAWKQERWVPAYFALAIVTMAWSAATMLEVKAYVISGTAAQWYFNKEGTKPSKSIRSSLRNAFGPSFGTVCFSGIVMGAVRVVRAVVDSSEEKQATPGFVNLILRCCADFLLSSFNFVNKFTINFAAITGEGYCSAAKMTYELLKRNLLSAVSVETVSTRVMTGIIFVLSALYAAAVCAVLNAVTGAHLKADVYIVAALAWLLLMVVLGYFVHVLHNVVDTIYVCYAIDRDKGEVCKQEAHDVFVHLPIRRNYRPIDNRIPSTA